MSHHCCLVMFWFFIIRYNFLWICQCLGCWVGGGGGGGGGGGIADGEEGKSLFVYLSENHWSRES